MNEKMGHRIRQLRKAQNISQEVLAQFLGVTFQAVSKWETGAAMPDVALIPVIASFFGVSTDELFDYNRLESLEKVREICQKAYEIRDSDPEGAETILREGLRKYPGNDVILNNLLYTMDSPRRGEEMITLCKTLIASTQDDAVKYDALRILARTYHELGQQALVGPTLEKIPELYFTKLQYMALLLEGEKANWAARQHMGLCLVQAVEMLMVMGRGEGGEAWKNMAQQLIAVVRQEMGADSTLACAMEEALTAEGTP